MAQQTHKLLINAADFPFSYFKAARSAIQNQDIGPRLPGFFAGSNANFDFGQPQLLFCENVMPVARGLMSPYLRSNETKPTGAPVSTFDRPFYLDRGGSAGQYRVVVPALGANYVLNLPVYFGFTPTLATPAPGGIYYSSAIVEGRSFICYPGSGIYEWDESTLTFVVPAIVYPPGVTIADIAGISSAGGYLVLHGRLDIYWCSPLNILDFNDIDQGAGSQIPADLQGNIRIILPIAGGAIIYTKSNAVGMRFTGNAAAPFIFKGIAGALGAQSPDQVCGAVNTEAHYSFSGVHLQKLTLTTCDNVFPELGEYLASGDYLEVWNPATKRVEYDTNHRASAVRLELIDNRYLFISPQGYDAATGVDFFSSLSFVFDLAHRRWGKIKVPHVAIFSSNLAVSGIPDDYICFLQYNGDLWLMRTSDRQSSYGTTQPLSVYLFGHIQERHDRFITVQELVLDTTETYRSAPAPGVVPDPIVTLIGSETGSDRDSTTEMALEQAGTSYRRYTSRCTAQNFDIAVEAYMGLNTVLAKVMKNGSR